MWKRRHERDISHFYYHVLRHRTASACGRSRAARSDVDDENANTRRCVLCVAVLSGRTVLAGLRGRWEGEK